MVNIQKLPPGRQGFFVTEVLLKIAPGDSGHSCERGVDRTGVNGEFLRCTSVGGVRSPPVGSEIQRIRPPPTQKSRSGRSPIRRIVIPFGGFRNFDLLLYVLNGSDHVIDCLRLLRLPPVDPAGAFPDSFNRFSCFQLHLLDHPDNLIGRRVGLLGPFPHLFGYDRGHDLLHPLGRLGHNLAPVTGLFDPASAASAGRRALLAFSSMVW